MKFFFFYSSELDVLLSKARDWNREGSILDPKNSLILERLMTSNAAVPLKKHDIARSYTHCVPFNLFELCIAQFTGCPIWKCPILKSYCSLIFVARHFSPWFLWWKMCTFWYLELKKIWFCSFVKLSAKSKFEKWAKS